jgi:hypothetical protein
MLIFRFLSPTPLFSFRDADTPPLYFRLMILMLFAAPYFEAAFHS